MASVLIVDDEDDVRRVLRRILERAGYETFEAKNGREAIESYKAQKPDVTITDIIMPDVEGIETIRELREQFDAKNIIAISGGGRTSTYDYLAMAQRLGASFVLRKPIDPRSLVIAVEQLVKT